MAKFLTYKALPELDLVVEYFEGQINLHDLIDFQLRQLDHAMCNLINNVITDLRNSEFIVLKNDVKKYADFVKNTEEKQRNRKVAIIADTPTQTAITMLYSSYTEGLPLNNKVFSTVEAAAKWLGITSVNILLVEKTLNFLKNNLEK